MDCYDGHFQDLNFELNIFLCTFGVAKLLISVFLGFDMLSSLSLRVRLH
jgi:hypothetical protein